jgi:hypothetical protein
MFSIFEQAKLESAYPGNAARDFYSGAWYGWLGYDVKADMDTCFPDDTILAELLADDFAAVDSKVMADIMDAGSAVGQRFYDDLSHCQDNAKVMAAAIAMGQTFAIFEAQDDW